jgi:hypothetical protein
MTSLLEGNKNLSAERDTLWDRATDLESELTEARASAAREIAALEARVKAAEARVVDEIASGEKHLVAFETEVVKNLADLCVAYERNVQSIWSPLLASVRG